MSFVVYAITAAVLLGVAHRLVLPFSRVAALLLFLLPFSFVGYALITDRAYGPINLTYSAEPLRSMRDQYGVTEPGNGLLVDLAWQIIPWRSAVQWSLAHAVWPIYNPFILSGDNLAGAAQPAPYSPFTLIACLLPLAKSLTYSAAIAFFIAALATFLFARDLGMSEVGALTASAVFMCSSPVTFFILWPLGFSWALLPVVLLGVRRVCVSGGSRSAVALLTVAFVLLLLAGHPETAAHVVLVATLYALFELVRHRNAAIRAAPGGVIAGILAMAICAVFVLPIIEVAPQTEQYQFRRDGFAKGPRGATPAVSLARLAVGFFPFTHLGSWLTPAVPPWQPVDAPIVGSVALAAAAYALWVARSAYRWFFAALAVFGMLAHAEWRPLARALQSLPLFDVMLNERLSFAAAFALAVLAGAGIDAFVQREPDRRFLAACTGTLVALAAGSAMLIGAGLIAPGSRPWQQLDLIADLGVLLALAAIAWVPRARFVAAVVVGLIVFQRAAEERGFYPVLPASAAYPPIPLFQPLQRIREPFRIVGAGLTMYPNTSIVYRLEDIRGYQALTNQRYVKTSSLWSDGQQFWFHRVDDLTKPFLSFLNVRYAVTGTGFQPPAGWRLVVEGNGARLLENERVLPRAFVPRAVHLGETDEAAIAQMAGEPDFRVRAWISSGGETRREEINGPGTATTRRTPHGYEMDVDMAGGGWVVVSEVAWKGWRAWIDGRPSPTRIANTAFLSVYVPAGQHNVTMRYLPRSFVVGRAITLTMLALIGLAAAMKARRYFATRNSLGT